MFGNMMGKLQEMKQKSEEVKKRLDTISVEGNAENSVKVILTANRKITSITFSDELLKEGDAEKIEDLSLIAINQALEKAEKIAEAEMQGIAKGMLPGF